MDIGTNPYAPPTAAVADPATDLGANSRRSRIAVIVSVNAALVGVLALLGGVLGIFRQKTYSGSVVGNAVIAFCGVLAIAAAIGLFRQRRWGAALWTVLTGLVVVVPIIVVPMRTRADLVLLGFLVAQLVGALTALWVTVRRQRQPDSI